MASWALYDYENHVAIKSEPNNKTPYFDFIIDRNVTVACVVEKEKYDVSAKPHPASIGKIQVGVSNQYYQTGETVPVQYEGSCTFKAREETIPEDYSFLGWFNENDEKVADSDSTTYQVQNVKAGFTLYAKVAVLVQIAASKSQDAASGKVHFSGESPAATADDYFALGDKVTINAVGGENANFAGWYLPDDTSFENPLDNYPASRELVVTAPVNLVA